MLVIVRAQGLGIMVVAMRFQLMAGMVVIMTLFAAFIVDMVMAVLVDMVMTVNVTMFVAMDHIPMAMLVIMDMGMFMIVLMFMLMSPHGKRPPVISAMHWLHIQDITFAGYVYPAFL